MIVHVLAFEVVTLLWGVWECDWAYLPPVLQEHQSMYYKCIHNWVPVDIKFAFVLKTIGLVLQFLGYITIKYCDVCASVCVCVCVCSGSGVSSSPTQAIFHLIFYLPPTSPTSYWVPGICWGANSRIFLVKQQWSRRDFRCPHHLPWGKVFLLRGSSPFLAQLKFCLYDSQCLLSA